MFKKLLKSLSELGYILIIDEGTCFVRNRETQENYVSFLNSEKIEHKEKILKGVYHEIKEIEEQPAILKVI